MVMKPGKHQSSKQRCHDLHWMVHDRAQSFVLRSYTMHDVRNQHVSIVGSVINNCCVFLHGQEQKKKKKKTKT